MNETMIKLQSAMEYLATYGWSVVIIGVVIAVLFEFGVFNSGQISAPSACIAQTGYLCSNPILNSSGVLNITFGQVSGNAYNITAVGCSNSTNIPNLFLSIHSIVPNNKVTTLAFSCPLTHTNVGSPFSGTLWIQYNIGASSTYEARIATVDAKVRTSSSISGGAGFVALLSVPIIITNSQSSNSQAPFQQMLTINSNNYAAFINSKWTNVEFSTGNASAGSLDSQLQAWVESNPSNTATATVVWVNLPSGVSASSNTVIYMDIMAGNVMSSSGPTGEASQLSSNYGQYDNGKLVFTKFYDNFSGSSLNTNLWTFSTVSGTITVNNGVTLSDSVGSGSADIGFKNLLSTSNTVIESLMNIYGSTGTDVRDRTNMFYNTGGGTVGFGFSGGDYGYFSTTSTADYFWSSTSTGTAIPIGSSASQYNIIDSQSFTSGVNFNWISYNAISYGTIYSNSGTFTAGSNLNAGYSATRDGGSGSTSVINIQWTRVRAYPPNGVMPTVTYGAA